MKFDVKKFTEHAIRVLKLTKKPKKQEFLMVAKITGIGILIIGLIGYIMRTIGILVGFI